MFWEEKDLQTCLEEYFEENKEGEERIRCLGPNPEYGA
jgi:hypothetical protein